LAIGLSPVKSLGLEILIRGYAIHSFAQLFAIAQRLVIAAGVEKALQSLRHEGAVMQTEPRKLDLPRILVEGNAPTQRRPLVPSMDAEAGRCSPLQSKCQIAEFYGDGRCWFRWGSRGVAKPGD
jgi:hypothetical protein